MATKKVRRNNKKSVNKRKNDSFRNETAGVLMITAGLLIGLAMYFKGGNEFFIDFRIFLRGLFGILSYILPPALIASGIYAIAVNREKKEKSSVFFVVLGIVSIFIIIHLFGASRYNPKYGFFKYIARSYEICSAFTVGSGAVGAVLTYLIQLFLGKVGGIILSIAFLLISVMFIYSLSLKKVGIKTAEVTKKAAAGVANTTRKAAIAYDEKRERTELKRAERRAKKSSLFIEELDESVNSAKEENEEETRATAESWLLPKIDEALSVFGRKKASRIKNADTDVNAFLLDLDNKRVEYNGNAEYDGDEREFITAPSIRLDDESIPAEAFEVEVEEDVIDTEDSELSENNGYDYEEDKDIIEEDPDDVDELPEDEITDEDGFDESNSVEGNDEIVKFYAEKINSGNNKAEENDELAEEDDPELPLTNRAALEKYEQTYTRPPLTILRESRTQDNVRMDREEMSRKTAIIEQTLKSFSISAKVTNTVRGPVLTRYELQPAPGVKVRRIVDLTKDIALNLAAEDIRIEAPIPGKAAIGIEVPNDEKKMVTARELIDSDEFRRKKTPITFALGKDIVGKNVYADIARMPHLLIAGETGSGKSVCINTIIVSLIYGASPEDVQLILVDPKKVELKPYEKIPHLRIPIVTDPKKAAMALNWAVAEMMTRYKVFASKGAKDLPRYNNIMIEEGREKLPYLVIIIDELADLMMTSSKEVEDAICRIAQLGRAAGIHLIIATQTPRVTVITGNIKANVPTKIAFAVSSQMDSRVILDMSGAEKLLGRGDMLYTPPGSSKPIRVQGCYIDDTEIEAITDFLTSENEQKYDSDLLNKLNNEGKKAETDSEEDEDDEKLEEAIRIAIELGQISSSMLQRKMKIGFNRAARIVDVMEERGYVSASEGAKPRQTLITMEEYNELYGDRDTD